MAEDQRRRQLSEHKKKPSLSKLAVKKWQCSRRDMEDRLKQISQMRDDESSPEREPLRGGSQVRIAADSSDPDNHFGSSFIDQSTRKNVVRMIKARPILQSKVFNSVVGKLLSPQSPSLPNIASSSSLGASKSSVNPFH